MRLIRVLVVGMIGAAFVQCSNDDASAPAQGPSGSIGLDGGTLALPGGVSVTVPAGAVPNGTELRVAIWDRPVARPPAGFVIVGPVVAVTPHGTTFSSPITIQMPASGRGGTIQTLSNDLDLSWEPVPSVERTATAFTFSVTHVSYFAELAAAGDAASSSAPDSGRTDASVELDATGGPVRDGRVPQTDAVPPEDAAGSKCGHIAATKTPMFDLIGTTGVPYTPGVVSPGAVSADGSTVVGYERDGPPQVDNLFRWRKSTGYEIVNGPGSYFEDPPFVNCDGTVVLALGAVYPDAALPGLRERILVTPTSKVVLQLLPGQSVASPRAMNADGTLLVGECQGGFGPGPVSLWHADGTVSAVGHGLTGSATPMAMSADGKYFTGVNGSSQVYRYSDATGVTVIRQGSNVAMSADGQTITMSWDATGSGFPKTFLWNASAGLSQPCGSVSCQVYVISGDGSVLIGDVVVDGSYEPFVWSSAHGMRHLNDVLRAAGVSFSTWTSYGVAAMTPDKRVVVGSVDDGHGNYSGYRLILPDGTFD